MDRDSLIHFVGGAVGGTAGTCLTCPLEVVKTRLQSSEKTVLGGRRLGPSYYSTEGLASCSNPSSSNSQFRSLLQPALARSCASSPLAGHTCRPPMEAPLGEFIEKRLSETMAAEKAIRDRRHTPRLWIVWHFRNIVRTEGATALFKGLGPNLVGVTPSKAVYFYAYSSCKRALNENGMFVPNSALVHMFSAGISGFIAASVVNPIWMVKTRLQLDHGHLSVVECAKRVYKKQGLKGFYRGVTASYYGISETIIQFVVYEHLRQLMLSDDNKNNNSGNSNGNGNGNGNGRTRTDYLTFMLCGGSAKLVAALTTYPCEVARTRLREEGSRYRRFWQTLSLVGRGEGLRGLYRGMTVQLLRTVPNTAITMATYELVVNVLRNLHQNDD